MTKITDETIDYVASLAKFYLSSEENETAKQDLSSILTYMETMNELNTDHIEPMSHVFPICNVFREDKVTNETNRDILLQNAPDSKEGYIKVPKTVE